MALFPVEQENNLKIQNPQHSTPQHLKLITVSLASETPLPGSKETLQLMLLYENIHFISLFQHLIGLRDFPKGLNIKFCNENTAVTDHEVYRSS